MQSRPGTCDTKGRSPRRAGSTRTYRGSQTNDSPRARVGVLTGLLFTLIAAILALFLVHPSRWQSRITTFRREQDTHHQLSHEMRSSPSASVLLGYDSHIVRHVRDLRTHLPQAHEYNSSAMCRYIARSAVDAAAMLLPVIDSLNDKENTDITAPDHRPSSPQARHTGSGPEKQARTQHAHVHDAVALLQRSSNAMGDLLQRLRTRHGSASTAEPHATVCVAAAAAFLDGVALPDYYVTQDEHSASHAAALLRLVHTLSMSDVWNLPFSCARLLRHEADRTKREADGRGDGKSGPAPLDAPPPWRSFCQHSLTSGHARRRRTAAALEELIALYPHYAPFRLHYAVAYVMYRVQPNSSDTAGGTAAAPDGLGSGTGQSTSGTRSRGGAAGAPGPDPPTVVIGAARNPLVRRTVGTHSLPRQRRYLYPDANHEAMLDLLDVFVRTGHACGLAPELVGTGERDRWRREGSRVASARPGRGTAELLAQLVDVLTWLGSADDNWLCDTRLTHGEAAAATTTTPTSWSTTASARAAHIWPGKKLPWAGEANVVRPPLLTPAQSYMMASTLQRCHDRSDAKLSGLLDSWVTCLQRARTLPRGRHMAE